MTGQDALVHLHLFQGRIVIRRDDQVDAILEILVDNVDRPCFPVKHPIKNVGTSFIGVQAYTISCSHLPTGDSYGFWRRIVLAWEIPTSSTHHSIYPSSMGRHSR